MKYLDKHLLLYVHFILCINMDIESYNYVQEICVIISRIQYYNKDLVVGVT